MVFPLGQVKGVPLTSPLMMTDCPCGSEALRSSERLPMHQPLFPGFEQVSTCEIVGGW